MAGITNEEGLYLLFGKPIHILGSNVRFWAGVGVERFMSVIEN